MEVSEVIYEGSGAPSQNKHPMEGVNRASGRGKQGGEYASLSISQKKFTHELKNKYVHRSNRKNPEPYSA